MLGPGGWARLRVVFGLVWGLWCRCRLVAGTRGLVGCKWGKTVVACARGGMLAVGCRGRVGLVRRVWWCVVLVGCRFVLRRARVLVVVVVFGSWLVLFL